MNAARPRIGLTLPLDGPAALAAEAERRGFDFVATGEHVAFHGPTPNAFVWLAAAAGATERIGLVSTLASHAPHSRDLLSRASRGEHGSPRTRVGCRRSR